MTRGRTKDARAAGRRFGRRMRGRRDAAMLPHHVVIANLITETGDNLVTESGDLLITES